MDVKERIQQKAEELFHRFGIRSVTMDEIASQLGISKKTIYQSFADKEELVFAVFNKYMAESRQRCLVDHKTAMDAVHEIFLTLDMMDELLQAMNPYILYDLEKYHPNVFKKFYEYKTDFLQKMIVDNLRRGIAEECYRPEINIEILSRYRLATIMMAMNVDVFPKGRFSVIEIEREILMLFLFGITTVKGNKLIHKYNQQRLNNKFIAV